ncbi:uncharacterized protein [Labrus bergylta]|uniref:uncharacterized protein n=1 Tax=Labrus bergylta TaxID=56723 RepID=UPI003313E0DF
MEGRHVVLLLVSAVVSLSPDCVCGSELKVTVRPGDNIILYCDCKTSTGVYIVWKRNCSHENQPSLFLRTRFKSVLNSGNNQLSESPGNPFPHYHMVRNQSSESYDLLIMNITGSEEGLYYCGTEETKVEDTDRITHRPVYTYGNVTRIILNSTVQFSDHLKPCDSCCVCWKLLISVFAASAVLSSFLSFLLAYCLCLKKAKHRVNEKLPDTRRQTGGNLQDEDVCYAALEIRNAPRRTKRMKTQSSDFSTYSAINTSRM